MSSSNPCRLEPATFGKSAQYYQLKLKRQTRLLYQLELSLYQYFVSVDTSVVKVLSVV